MKKIQRAKRLKENLIEIKLGDTCEINTRDYKPSTVRSMVYDLNKLGYKFISTERNLIDSIKVTRLK